MYVLISLVPNLTLDPSLKIPFGFDNPRKIAHEPSIKAFGVAFTTVEPNRVSDPEISRSSFKLLDDTSFASPVFFTWR